MALYLLPVFHLPHTAAKKKRQTEKVATTPQEGVVLTKLKNRDKAEDFIGYGPKICLF